MNIIGNNCVGGRLYESFKLQFNNPFMWMRILPEDFPSFVENFDKLNLKNVKFSLETFRYKDKLNVLCRLDNKVNVHFTHYFLDEAYNEPTTISSNVYYKEILSYTKKKWFERLSRMKNNEPTFLFCTNKINRSDDEVLNIVNKLIKIKTNHKIYIVINNNIKVKTTKNNIHLIYLEEDKLNADTAKVAKFIKDNIK